MTQQPHGSPHGYPPSWPVAPSPRKPRFGLAARIGMIIGAVLLVGLLGKACGGPSTQTSASPEASTSPARPTGAVPTAPEIARAAPSATVSPVGLGSGTWIVGADLQLGTYRSQGAEPGFFEFCTWSTKAGPSTNSKTINFGTANANEPMVVEINSKVKAFVTSNCEPWIKIG